MTDRITILFPKNIDLADIPKLFECYENVMRNKKIKVYLSMEIEEIYFQD